MNFSLFLAGGLADYGAVMLFKAKTREISGKTVRSSFGRLPLDDSFVYFYRSAYAGLSLYI